MSQSASAEANAVATVVEALALSRPDVGFALRSDGRRTLALPASADLRERIAQVHGLSLARSLVSLEDPVLWGFVSPLAVSFPTRRYLHVAVNGRVVEADYSQIEPRLVAKMWDEPIMLETFREGGDVHTITARSITGKEEVTKGERKLAKAVNFGLIFGQGAKGLRDYARDKYGVEMTLQEAGLYRTRFFQAYRGIARWHAADDTRHRRGQLDTRTLAGRLRRDVRSYTEHLNAPVQGTAADGMKMALALLWERRGECPGAVPVLAVHDDLVVECDEEEADKAEAWLKKAMVDGMNAVVNVNEPKVPMEVEASVSQAWGD